VSGISPLLIAVAPGGGRNDRLELARAVRPPARGAAAKGASVQEDIFTQCPHQGGKGLRICRCIKQ